MLTDNQIRDAIPTALTSVDIAGLGEKYDGKVRDMYRVGDRRALITTDRVSAFDRVLGTIPFKGQVLTQLSAWWFEQLTDVVSHHVVDVPDPNVIVAREAEPLPVEVIVRGYITGSTSTSLWTLYNEGVDRPYGLDLPAGLVKNSALPQAVITPTTKAEKVNMMSASRLRRLSRRGWWTPNCGPMCRASRSKYSDGAKRSRARLASFSWTRSMSSA